MAGAPPQSPRKYSLSAAFRHPANSLIGGWCRIVRRIRRPCFLLGLFRLQLAMLADACNCARPSRDGNRGIFLSGRSGAQQRSIGLRRSKKMRARG